MSALVIQLPVARRKAPKPPPSLRSQVLAVEAAIESIHAGQLCFIDLSPSELEFWVEQLEGALATLQRLAGGEGA